MAAAFALACFCALLVVSVSLPSGCDIPREKLCQSKKDAARCGVLQECGLVHMQEPAPKVNLAVYHEVFCIDCAKFYSSQLMPAFLSINSILNVTLVPYGGAMQKKEGDKWVISCYTKKECVAIAIEACTIDIVKDMFVYLPFLNCFQELGLNHSAEVLPKAKECADRFLMPLDDILRCADSDRAAELLHRYGDMTDALKPKITWFPWMVLNGVHTKEIQKQVEYGSLVKAACGAYKGPKPTACTQK